MQKFLLLMCLLGVSMAFESRAQTTVSGTVTSSGGEPLPGVNVLIKNTTQGTVTDIDGNYTLELEEDQNILLFSFIGFKTEEVEVNNRNHINVTMKDDISQLEEVVVIGYGTQEKRNLTGSIASIDGSEIAEQPVPNPLSALQGKASGVLVTNSGRAGAAPTIRIRGVGSINGVAPLYIVDGIFADNIDFVNPADIESIEILKDPSSLAVFGVQGANGAIIVTTKRAKAGETSVNFNSYVGFQHVRERIGLTNADQFKMLYNEQLANLGEAPFDFSQYGSIDTDWQDEILRRGFITNNSLSFRSGTEKSQTTFSLSYLNQEGVQKYDEYTRYTARLREELTLSDHIKVGADINGYRWQRNPTSYSIAGSLYAAPVFAPKDAEGNWMSSPTFQRAQVSNPVAQTEIHNEKNISEGYRFVASAWAEINFLKNFTWKSVMYGDWGFNDERQYYPIFQIGSEENNSVSQFRDETGIRQEMVRYTTYQQDHTLTFNKNIGGDHDITLLGGIVSRYVSKGLTLGGRRTSQDPVFIPDNEDFWYLSIEPARTSQELITGLPHETSFLSFLFRANYAFQNKYLVNGTFRRDGTSKFSPKNRWGNFGSIGLGWVISEEAFMNDINVIDFLKLKASWGALGNDKVGNYRFYPTLSNNQAGVFGENILPAVSPTYIANPNLKWETVKGYDVGFDAALLDDRLSASFSYYNRESTDLLVTTDIPSARGADQFLTNLGSIVNRGVETSLSWSDNITSDLTYRASGNFTTVHNEVTSIGDDITFAIIKEQSSRTIVGLPVGHFYGLVQEGIFQTAEEIAASPQAGMAQPGDIKYKDVDGDGIFDADKDRTMIGSYIPDVTYAFSFGLTYKNFDFDIQTQGVAGNSIYRERSRSRFAVINYEEERLGRWTGPGTSNTEPILDNTRPNNYLHSTYFLDPGDYFRIRNVSLGYNFSSEFLNRLNMESAKIYINAQNLMTFHKARNYSPEVSGGSAVRSGIDDGVYPIPATYTIGVNVNF